MKVLILGASGLIGGNSARHLTNNLHWEVLGTYFSYAAKNCFYYNTLDLNDVNNHDIDSFHPEVIIHCGALTWVDYCETHEEESHDKTVKSTINAIALAQKFKAKFVYLSTDYVFDGKNGPDDELSDVNPISVYGKHKLEAEAFVINSGLEYLICRVTNVYGDEERGKNFIARLIQQAISGEKKSFDFPVDQFATPANALDVAKAIASLLSDGKVGIYNLSSTDYLNRYQLAQRVLKYFPDNQIEINPILTEKLKQDADRPLYGGLIPAKFLNEYPTFEFSNVDDYIQDFLKNN